MIWGRGSVAVVFSALMLAACGSDPPAADVGPHDRDQDDADAGDAPAQGESFSLKVIHAGSALPAVDVWATEGGTSRDVFSSVTYGELTEARDVAAPGGATPITVVRAGAPLPWSDEDNLGAATYQDFGGQDLVGVVVGDDASMRRQPFGLLAFANAIVEGGPENALFLCVLNGSRRTGNIGVDIVGAPAADLSLFVDSEHLAFGTPACFGIPAETAFDIAIDINGSIESYEERIAIAATYPPGAVLLAVYVLEGDAPKAFLHRHGTDELLTPAVTPY